MGTVLPALAPHVRTILADPTILSVLSSASFRWWRCSAVLCLGSDGGRAGTQGRIPDRARQLHTRGAIYLLPLGLTGIWLGRCFQGLGEACLYTGAAAWAVELAGTERSAQALGYLSSGIWGGLSAGPVVGNWLVTFHRAAFFQMLAGAVGFLMLTRVPEHFVPHEGRRHFEDALAISADARAGGRICECALSGSYRISDPASGSIWQFGTGRVHGLCGRDAVFAVLSGRIAGSRASARHVLLRTDIDGRGVTGAGFGTTAGIAVAGAALLGLGFSFPFSSIASTVMRQSPDHERGLYRRHVERVLRSFCGGGIVCGGCGRNQIRLFRDVCDGGAGAGRFRILRVVRACRRKTISPCFRRATGIDPLEIASVMPAM